MGKRGPKSVISRLDPKIKTEINRLLVEEDRSIDEVVAHLSALHRAGAVDEAPSRSSVARHSRNLRRMREDMQRLRAVSEMMDREFGAESEEQEILGLIHLCKSLAAKVMDGLADADADIAVKEFMQAMKGMRDLLGARQTVVATRRQIREQTLREGAEIAEAVARRHGMDAAARAAFKADFLGMANHGLTRGASQGSGG